MNAERLHAVTTTLRAEMASRAVVGKMQSMVSALQSVVQQSNANTQQNLSAALTNLYDALTGAPSDAFSPAWRQILREIGGEDLFGKELKDHIETTLARNQITLAVALQEIEVLLQRLQEFEKALNDITSAFRHFRIGSEQLQAGEAEIGILIPRRAVHNQLFDFADELENLTGILNTFSEVATGETDRLEIRTISSSDLMVHVSASASFAACIAFAVERIVAFYKNLLEVRKLQLEIKKFGVPEEKTSGIEEWANELMEKGISETAPQLVKEFYKKADKGRQNELVIAVKIAMNKLANRIDNGFSIEVRIEPLPAADVSPEDDVQKAVELIQAATPNMQFLKLEGQPLLRLPEGDDKAKKRDKGSATPKKEHA